jgi:lysophospholipase L1-like esterase
MNTRYSSLLLIASACAGLAACGGSPTESELDFYPDSSTSIVDSAVTTPDAGGAVQDAAQPAADAGPTLDGGTSADASAGPDAARADGGLPDGGSDGAAPEAGSDAAVPDAGPTDKPKPKCVKKDSQVVVIGDSFISWLSHKFPEQLKTVTKQEWRMKAIGGTAMGSGGLGRIPDQFYEAVAQDPDVHTVLMDGGGNDVLVPDLLLDNPLFGACRETGSSKNMNCNEIIKRALDAAGMLMDKAAAAGVRDVVYFFYPHIPEGRLIGGPKPNEILDHSLPMVESFCNGAEARTKGKLRCHFINMVPVFEGHIPGFGGVTANSEADWFNEDIHPNPKGSQAMVDKVWQVMTDKCIGQKGKDCCEP